MWIISVILLLFEFSLASNCDSSASAFQEQGLRVAMSPPGYLSLLLSIYVLSVATTKYSHQQATWERNHLFSL